MVGLLVKFEQEWSIDVCFELGPELDDVKVLLSEIVTLDQGKCFEFAEDSGPVERFLIPCGGKGRSIESQDCESLSE